MKASTIIGALAILVFGGAVWFLTDNTNTTPKNSEEEETDISQLIQVNLPLPNQKVTSPLKISGKAVGNWYFEASFPVKILDANGNMLGSAPAQAQGDWMTTDFVPFEVTITFDKPATATGTVALLKDNPSGLPEHDNSISIPVSF
jgi:hypothetical protein